MFEEFPNLTIEPLAPHHDRGSFSCGKEPVDRYLRERARKEADAIGGRPYILVSEAGSAEILGFYKLSNYTISLGTLPEDIRKKIPRYDPMSATLLGWFGIAKAHQGKRLGPYLLAAALKRALELSEDSTSAVLVVDAIDQDAYNFYVGREFIPLTENRLFLPMATIREAFR